jgi:chemotaxis protein MotB
MALARNRGGQRFSTSIWPGFVDAMTALLMVLMFVLTIFMIVQFSLRETINTQGDELAALTDQLAGLADALGLERDRSAALGAQVTGLTSDLSSARDDATRQAALIANLTSQIGDRNARLADAEARITSFEAQVASLLADRDAARGQVADLTTERERLMSDQEALNLALASARSEIDAQAEAARLDAARREALDALVADLRAKSQETGASLADALAALTTAETKASDAEARLTDLSQKLSAEEEARLAEAAAATLLRERLKNSEDELTAMTLALEAKRKEAEDTLTMLAAANAARDGLDAKLAAALLAQSATTEELAAARAAAEAAQSALSGKDQDRGALEQQLAAALAAKLAAENRATATMTAAEERATLLAAAQSELASERANSAEAARKLALLNEQIVALRGQLGSLQSLLDASAEKDAGAKVQIEALGSQLNSALAQVAAEQRRRAELEEAERLRLEAEAKDLRAQTVELSRYRSEFFGKLSQVLAGREGVRVVGDRFVFSSEVLFQPGSADLSPEGRDQIAGVVSTLAAVAAEIPPEVNWIIRVDGHTDNVPLLGSGQFRDNWELSQGRALSVVRYMQDVLGFPPDRLAATGFGEYQPVAEGDTPEARALNRRIEMKLTER